MTTLVVVTHPDPGSLTAATARRVVAALRRDGEEVEVADLAAEGFDPRFSAADVEHYRGRTAAPGDVAAEQARVDAADHLVLVFPLYWWSVPALLKGWIDRVFGRGWAYDDSGSHAVGLLGRLTVSFVAVAGSDEEGFRRHGYDTAVRTQLEDGILDFCGMRHGANTVVFDSESSPGGTLDARVDEAVAAVVGAAPAPV